MTSKELQLIKIAHLLSNPWIAFALAVLAIWVIVWKGTALWKASQKGELAWFIILLVLNTLGILEILYIFWLNKYSLKKK